MNSPQLVPVLAIVLLLPLLHGLAVAQSTKKPLPAGQTQGTFEVKVNQDRLSLQAVDSPLSQVLQEIARQAKITIDSNIGPEEKITNRLDRVLLEDGIRQLAKNVSFVYAQDAKSNSRRIARVIVLSETRGVSAPKTSPQPEKANQAAEKPAKATTPQQRPEPFKFEFDPRNVPEKKATPGKQP
jgi:hypothetical protein